MHTHLAILADGAPSAWALWAQPGLILVLLIFSAAFSGSESVLFSLNRTQLLQCAASANPFRRLAASLMGRPKRTLTTILLGNTAVNVLLFAAWYVFFRNLAGRYGAWISPMAGVASVMLVVTCGEVLPKIVGVHLCGRLAPFAAGLTRVAAYGFGPLGRVLDVVLVEPFARLLLGRPSRPEEAEPDLSPAELKTLLDMSRFRGTIDQTEDVFLREVIDLGHLRVRDVMVPRVQVCAYDVNDSPDGLRELMRRTRHKKIPVYEDSLDHVVGMVYAKVLFLQPVRSLRAVAVSVRFVPELITCEQLLHHFRVTRSQVALAVDEYGGVAGLVTLEDVLEEIVGEIHDPEEKVERPAIIAVADTEYDISGRLGVHDWSEALGLPRLAERVATVGGLVTARLGRPARVGDEVRLGNVRLEVTQVQRRRIERLRVHLLAGAREDA